MATYDEVEKYLKDIKFKIIMFGIIYRTDRTKNQQTILNLEISPDRIKETINKLKVEDYSEGPLEEKLHGILPMWVFGKIIKKQEIYIKISMGTENNSAVCISFHKAQHPMNYPFKK